MSVDFVTTVLTALGIAPVAPPSAQAETARLLCDRDELDDPDFAACKERVTRIYAGTPLQAGAGAGPETQRRLFVGQHFELLNVSSVDRTVSSFVALRNVAAMIPPWLWVFIVMVGVVAIVPAVVILVHVAFDGVAILKIATVAGLAFCVGVFYVLAY